VQNLLRALRSRNFRLFFGGQAVSLIGTWMQMTAQSWLMYRLTDSNLAVGVLGAAQTGPGLLVGPLAGALADRHDRRLLLIATQVLSLAPSFLLGGLTLLGWINPVQLVLIALVAGVIRSAEVPIRQALVPDLVEREDLFNAISLHSALFNSARVVGPALAGAVIALSNEGWCFMANAVSFLAPIAALVSIRLPAGAPRKRSGESMLAEVLEGVRYVRGQPFVFALLGGLLIASLFGMPYSVLLPSFAHEVLGGSSSTYSLLTSAVGAGAILSALTLAARAGVDGLERVPALGGAIFGTALLLLSQARTLWIAVPLMALVGIGFMTQMTTTNTLLQLAVPDHLRGRVMSLHSTLFLGVVPLGGLIAGTAADRLGQGRVFAVSGALLLVGTLLFGRELLRSGQPIEETPIERPEAAIEPETTPPA
jgi:MFS family permease